MIVATETTVHVPTDHEPRSGYLDRVEQFPTPDVLDAAGVQLERAVPVVERRLMRYQNVDAVRDRRIDRLEFARPFHERPAQELVGPRRCPY
jgi:hypothetical protein